MLPQLKFLSDFYQEVIYAFSKSNELTLPQNKEEILSQSLWGNRFITFQNKLHSRTALYFESFIKSNIFQIKHLSFKNGIVDESYIYQIVKDKSNIFREITILRQALKQFKLLIQNHQAQTHIHNHQLAAIQQQNYYQGMTNKKLEKNLNENKILRWCHLINNEVTFNHVYIRRIKQVNDKKIAEFNYKILHDILPCNANLKKWKIIDSDKCNFCNGVQDIPHLLYYCKYANAIWCPIEGALKITIGIHDVILGVNEEHTDFALSVIAFLIYKYWLLNKDTEQDVCWEDVVKYLKAEIISRINIYQYTRWYDLCKSLQKVVLHLQ